MRSYFDPIDEQERLARNKPHPGIDKAYPKVTDGTTASIIQKTPRRVIQQLPTGSIVNASEDWLKIMAGFIFTDIILKNANGQFPLIQKCWTVLEKALAHGGQTGLITFSNRGDYFGTDLLVPYIKDVLFESGKVSDRDSNVLFLRSWYQPRDIESIIRRERRLKQLAKERGEVYESGWNLSALAKCKDDVVAKSDDETSKYEKSKDNAHKGGVPIIHAFQNGIGAEFYSFHQSDPSSILRTKVNKDPRGVMPLSTMYFGTDGSNPVGRGVIEMVGSLQNLMDAEMQMYQFERALMLAPPTIKRGNWNKSQAKLLPNAIVDLGNDPAASWEVLKRDSAALQQFPENYGLLKSQLLTVASAPDASISASSGNPTFSKTDAGVDMQQANVSVDDNHVRKQFESWYEEVAETMINLYFAEREGIEDIKVDNDTAAKLRKIDPALVNEENMVRMDWSAATEKLKFEVDASTSNMKDNTQQLEALSALLERMDNSPVLQGIIPPKKVVATWNSIVAASGVEDPEELQISDEEMAEMEQAAAEQAMAEQEAAMQQEQMAAEQGQLPPEQMPKEEAPVEQPAPDMAQPVELSPEDQDFAFQLQDMGYSPEQIDMALSMDAEGVPNEQIIQALEAM